MDIGYITFWAAPPGESQEECFAANFNAVDAVDEMGWDTVWIGGVPSVHGGNDPHPLVLASAIATRTRRIKIGAAVHLPGLKAPGERFVSEVRQGASTIDRGGRLKDVGTSLSTFCRQIPSKPRDRSRW